MPLLFILQHYRPGRLDPGAAFAVFRRRTGLKRPIPWRACTAAAAAVLLVVFFIHQYRNAWEECAAYDSVRTVVLRDGTEVSLAPGSTLSWQPRKKDRLVRMSGRARYCVARDESRPFVVRAADLEVTVLGTVFTVTEGGRGTRVDVSQGRVRVCAADASEELRAGESAVLDGTGLQKRPSAPNPCAWATGRFVYEAVPLEEVLAELSAHYGVRMEAAPTDRRLTAEFGTDMTAEQVAELICLALDVEIKITDPVSR